MALLALGINHKTASVDLREKIAFDGEQLSAGLAHARATLPLQEVAILSTCNRTEFYLVGQIQSQQLLAWLAQQRQLDPDRLHPVSYVWQGEEALRHMMRVASGLDSMILGEPQILGQMKTAYQQAQQAGTLGGELDRVFQNVFACAKQVRTETQIGAHPVSVGYAAVSLARRIFSDLKKTRALLVGAGETIRLVALHLREQGVSDLIVANRTLARATELATEIHGRAVTLQDIPDVLGMVDLVITSTASPLPLIGKGMVEKAQQKRRYQPMLMVDIAVPRDVEPEVADIDHVYLYSVDDLMHVIEDNRKARVDAAGEAEHIIVQRARELMLQRQEQAGIDAVRRLRAQVEEWRQAELQKALQALASGQEAAQVIERLSRTLTNKFTHQPSVVLRSWSAAGDQTSLQAGLRLLGLDTGDDAS